MYRVRLGAQGRIVIPAPLRRTLGLRPGETLLCQAAADRLIFEARRKAERDLWERFAKLKAGSLARELIRERRREAKREASE
jgi:AbrB family looped-hinge helix DNA binding protein